jgi:hypothetical protein
MTKKNQIIILSFTGALFILTILSLSFLNRIRADIAQASNPTIVHIDPYKEDIETCQALLQRPDLSTEGRVDIEGRLNVIGMLATQRSAGLIAIPYITITIPPRPTDMIGSKLPDGIYDKSSWSFR